MENSLEENVFLYGNCKDVDYVLSQASLGVLSSKSEGLPISLLEYGLKSLPVLVTNVGDCGTVVKNGVTGCIVEKENFKQLAKGILFLLKETENSKMLGVNLNKFVSDKYGLNNYISNLSIIYRDI
jgi:glycosyltransferase involved in cell wall biosynthesis